jgi:D-threo-aldose 1-dehydrogenase
MHIFDRRLLPRAGYKVPVFGLGCSQLDGLYHAMSDDDAQALVDAAWNGGVRMFDSAPLYGHGLSEQRLGTALRGRRRADFVLSTKVGRLLVPDDRVRPGDGGWAAPLPFRPEYNYTYEGVMRSFEASLARLDVDRIDVVYVHDIGAATHGGQAASYWEQLTRAGGFRALDELRRQRIVEAVGLGVNECQAALDGMREFDLDCTMLAGRYTLLEQAALSPFLEECMRRDHRVVAAAPFNSGVLAGGEHFDYDHAPPSVKARVRALNDAARDFGVTLPAAALQFPLAHPAIVACVVGAHRAGEIEQAIGWFGQPIAPAFWHALRERGLVDAASSLPDGGLEVRSDPPQHPRNPSLAAGLPSTTS